MHAYIRLAVSACALALLSACDSMPGAIEPETEGPARLIVLNTGSRTITSVELRACGSGSLVKWSKTSIGPSQSWSYGYDAGCYGVSVDFNSGGGWGTSVQLSATQSQTIRPF